MMQSASSPLSLQRDSEPEPSSSQVPPAAAAAVGVQAEQEAPDPGMEKVRTLLFGAQMREYDRRFAELSKRMDGELERLREEQGARIARLEAFVRGGLERLTTQHHQERQERIAAHQALSDRLEGLERELGRRIEALDARLCGELLEIRGALQGHADEHADALHRTHRSLSEALEKECLRLQEEKTGRDELAQFFSELALRLNRELELPRP